MKTGIELIAQERQEQIEKHGFTVDSDIQYEAQELLWAAQYCLTGFIAHWPSGWSIQLRDKIAGKSQVERLAVSGAFIAAHIDLINATS